MDGGDRLEGALAEHGLWELDVEGVLQRQHDVHARVRGEAQLEEVVVIAHRCDVDREACVVRQHLSDLLVHHRSPCRGDAPGRGGRSAPPFSGGPLWSSRAPRRVMLGAVAGHSQTTTAAARAPSWVRLTEKL